MTEILTESFCERCGTRYTFESARPRARLKGVRVLSRGLKNFVLSDGTSMDEAMASARSEADRESTAHQLDAFHNTFSFCMSCRQYACANCWNEPEARCLSCAPLALAPGLVEVGDVSQVQVAPQFGDPLQGNGAGEHEHVWGGNGTTEPFAGAEPATEPAMAAEPIVAAEPVVETFVGADPIEAAVEPTGTAEPVRIAESVAATEPGVEVEAVQASESVQADVVVVDPAEPVAAPEPEATPVVPSDPIGKATAQTAGLLRRFRPGQSLDAELAAFERARIEPAAIVEPQPTAPSEDPSTQSGVVGRAPRARPQAEADAIDVVPQPTWQITAPDSTSTTPFPSPAQSPSGAPHQPAPTRPTTPASGEPQWPAKPEWPNSAAAAGLPYLGRPANAVGGIEALWAASNQELATARPTPGRGPTGIQPCVSCGLSLSATARFCRRCGTLQGS